MIDTLQTFSREHAALLGWLALGSAVMLVVSLITLPVIAVLLPQDFLIRTLAPARSLPPDDWRRRHPAWRWTLRGLKNLAGVVLALAGLAMLVLPGQGLITLALALLLLDLPGKRRLEARLLGNPRFLSPINKLRQRLGRAPLDRPD